MGLGPVAAVGCRSPLPWLDQRSLRSTRLKPRPAPLPGGRHRLIRPRWGGRFSTTRPLSQQGSALRRSVRRDRLALPNFVVQATHVGLPAEYKSPFQVRG